MTPIHFLYHFVPILLLTFRIQVDSIEFNLFIHWSKCQHTTGVIKWSPYTYLTRYTTRPVHGTNTVVHCHSECVTAFKKSALFLQWKKNSQKILIFSSFRVKEKILLKPSFLLQSRYIFVWPCSKLWSFYIVILVSENLNFHEKKFDWFLHRQWLNVTVFSTSRFWCLTELVF